MSSTNNDDKNIFHFLKNINPHELEKYLDDFWELSYEEGIELTYIYVKKLIKRISVEKEVKTRWIRLNEKYRKAFMDNERIHLFRTCTGSGKTVTSVLWVKFLIQLSDKIEGFVILSAEYEHGTNEIERIMLKHGNATKYVRFEGKNRLCKELSTVINKRGVTIEGLMKKGISIMPYCEDACISRSTCVYLGNCETVIAPIERGGIKNWIGVQHQLGNFLPIFLHHVGDIILIIDEDFTDAIKSHFLISIPLIHKCRQFLKMVLEKEKIKLQSDIAYNAFVKEMLSVFEEFERGIFDVGKKMNYEKLCESFDKINEAKGTDSLYLNRLNKCAFKYVKNELIEPFNFVFSRMCNFIDNYSLELLYDLEIEVGHIEQWIRSAFYKKQDKMLLTFLYYDKYVLIKLFGKDNIRKIIINDATANKLILKYIIGDQEPIIEHNEDWMYEKCEIRQLKKQVYDNRIKTTRYALYPKSSFYHKRTFDFLMDDLFAIIDRHPEETILVVARDIKPKHIKFADGYSLSEYIYNLKGTRVIFEDYPLSATNIYSDINIVVLLGRPELPRAVIKRQGDLMGISPEIYRDIYSRNQMEQAMGRIFRGNKQKYVYILSGFEVKKNVSIISYKSHSDLQKKLNNEQEQIEKKKESIKIERELMDYLNKYKEITTKEYLNLIKVSYYKAQTLLKSFLKQNKIKKKGTIPSNKGGGRETIYYL